MNQLYLTYFLNVSLFSRGQALTSSPSTAAPLLVAQRLPRSQAPTTLQQVNSATHTNTNRKLRDSTLSYTNEGCAAGHCSIFQGKDEVLLHFTINTDKTSVHALNKLHLCVWWLCSKRDPRGSQWQVTRPAAYSIRPVTPKAHLVHTQVRIRTDISDVC